MRNYLKMIETKKQESIMGRYASLKQKEEFSDEEQRSQEESSIQFSQYSDTDHLLRMPCSKRQQVIRKLLPKKKIQRSLDNHYNRIKRKSHKSSSIMTIVSGAITSLFLVIYLLINSSAIHNIDALEYGSENLDASVGDIIKTRKLTSEPFLILLSRSELSLVELPLIDNGQISAIYKLSEDQCFAPSTNQDLDRNDEATRTSPTDIDSVGSETEFIKGEPSGRGSSEESRTQDSGANGNDQAIYEYEQNVKSNGQINNNSNAITNSNDTSKQHEGQDEIAAAAAAVASSGKQMRKKRAAQLATSLGKSDPSRMVNLKKSLRRRMKRHESDIKNNGNSYGQADAEPTTTTDFKLEQAHAEAQHGQLAQQQQRQIATFSDMDADDAKSGFTTSSGKHEQQQLAQANDCELNDFDVHMQQGLIFASNNRGQIHRIQLELVARPQSTDNNSPSSSLASDEFISSSAKTSASGNQTDQEQITATTTAASISNELHWTTPPSSASLDTLERSRDEPTTSQHPSNKRMFSAADSTSGPSQANLAQKQASQHDRIIWSRSKQRRDKGAWWANRKQQLASEQNSNGNRKNKNSTRLQGGQSLAVDWINDVLFVLDQNRLFCIDFEGKREILLIDDFIANTLGDLRGPLNLRVDPLNNFLFWLQPGRFHASIYRLDLGVLLSNELTMERMRSNLNKSTIANAKSSIANANDIQSGSSGNGGNNKGPFDIANQEALISRHYAHPIITNLPKQTKLFFIDHKNSRIYVPIAQSQQTATPTVAGSDENSSANLEPSTQNNLTLTSFINATNCNDSTQEQAATVGAGTGQGQILTYNLDSSDAGPLRSGSEREHWSSFQPGLDMQDLGLDSSQNLLYWLTNSGRGIFEEYLGDDGKLHSAQHTLDGQNVYSKLIYFSPLANQTNQPTSSLLSNKNTDKHNGNKQTKSPIGTLMNLLADHQEHLNSLQQVNLKHKKSIQGLSSWSSADLLVNGPMDLRSDGESASSSTGFMGQSKPWLILLITGLFLALVYFVYALVFDHHQRNMLHSDNLRHDNERGNSSPSSADSMHSSTLSSRAGARFIAGANTISRWIQTKGNGTLSRQNINHVTTTTATRNDVACSVTGLSSQTAASGYPHSYKINTPTTPHFQNRHQLFNANVHIGNAIDEHYGQEQVSLMNSAGLSSAELLGLPALSEWPSSISDFTNKLYVPIELMEDEELAAIRRISSEKLEIDRHSAPLGKGHFGTVLQGIIKNCSASERAELLTPQPIVTMHQQQLRLSPQTQALQQPHYENQSRLESLLNLQANNVIPKSNEPGLPLNGNGIAGNSGGSSTSGHASANSASPSDVFLTAHQLTSASAGSVTNTANTGDYLTPKSQCGQSVSDYDDRQSSSIANCNASAIANPTYMFNPATQTAAVAATANISTLLLMKSSPFRVAIKQLKEDATEKEKQDFLQEAKLLAKFNHRNIVQLIGICLDRGSTFIVMELMLGGDLIRYMRKQCENKMTMLQEDDLLSICLDIVDGCCYLAEQNYIHRDLAARNCLVSSCRREERVVKLADFGLARDIYEGNYYKQSNKDSAMPLKWMAPECLCDGPTFTSQSDVWSFGVVMWEVTNYCKETPYLTVTPFDLKKYLDAGNRLSKSEYCDEDLYKLMLSCWRIDPECRPTFRECQIELIEIRNKQQKKRQQQSVFQQSTSKQEQTNDESEYEYHNQRCEI